MRTTTRRRSSLVGRLESLLWASVAALLPSFCRPPAAAPASPDRQATAQLDGLRGLAAVVVYVLHLSMAVDRNTLLGLIPGVSGAFYHAPVVRLFRAGKAMVRIFFVLSGYALSIAPVRHFGSAAAAAALHRRLAVAALKRPFRLFLPPLISTLAVLLFVLTGLFPTPQSLKALPAHLLVQTVVPRASPWLQVYDWLVFITYKLVNPWDWVENLYANEHDSYYGPHLWTIQTEFRCSMILFLVLGVVSVLRHSGARYITVVALTIFASCWGRWDVALFFAGMHLCLVDQATPQRTSQPPPIAISNAPSERGRRKRPRREAFLLLCRWAGPWFVLFLGLWALSYPDDKASQALGFGFMSKLYESPDFWQSLGAVSVIWSASKLRYLKDLLRSAPLQYLGSLSFSLYLVHYPFLELAGWRFYLVCRQYISDACVLGGVRYGLAEYLGSLFGFVVVTACLVWISDLTMRLVDLPSQRFVSRLVKYFGPE